MASPTLSAPRQRATEALDLIAHHHALSADLDALHRAGDRWEPLAIAQLAEAVAGLLLDVRPRPGTMKRERR